jgi:glucosamine-6-phosphate deaminase
MTTTSPAGSSEKVRIVIHSDPVAAGSAAADEAASILRSALSRRGIARVVFASAPSQDELLRHLTAAADLEWSRLEVFHMDEYVGLPNGASQSFGHWLSERLALVRPARIELIQPGENPEAEARRYAGVLAAQPIDLTCLGVGINGHIAFNEPGQARFDDLELVRVVSLHEESRQQQVDDGCFGRLAEVPHSAVTLTVPALLRAHAVVGVVPGRHKASAVQRMLRGPIGTDCPATALRTHRRVTVHLDAQSAALLDSDQR